MGTIVERRRKNGVPAYQAQIFLKKGGATLHREVKTFEQPEGAAKWLLKREKALARPGAIAALKGPQPTLADAIDRYIRTSRKELGRTKAQVLRTIKTKDIAAMRCCDITSKHLVEWLEEMVAEVTPQTVANYLAHLRAVFAIARPAWDYPLDTSTIYDATTVAKRLGLTSKSRSRSRRPTLEELNTLLTHFEDRQARSPMAPMSHLIIFALFSTRRLSEITRLAWKDLDEEQSRVLVRDMKNPGQTQGNDVWVELVPEAMAFVSAAPKTAPEIFPYNANSVSTAFTRACALLGIEDLHFHDLRHDGVSRLFEMGWTLPQTAAVSGHRSWASLQRYTHVRTRGDKYADWHWKTRPLDPQGS